MQKKVLSAHSFYYGDDNDGYPVSLNPYFRTSPTGQFINGQEKPNYDPEFEAKVDAGISAHEGYYDIMLQDNFKGVRDAWIQAYKDLDDPNKITGKSEKELYKAIKKYYSNAKEIIGSL